MGCICLKCALYGLVVTLGMSGPICEWAVSVLSGCMVVKMAVRACQVDRTVHHSGHDGGTVQLPAQETSGVWLKGGADRWSPTEHKSCWASMETDAKPRQKRHLLLMGSCIAGSKCTLLPRKIAPKMLSSSDLVTSTPPSW